MSSHIPHITILYLDDEMNNLVSFKATYRLKYKVFTAQNAKDAKAILEKEDIHIVISDQRMPDIMGSEFLSSIIEDHPLPIRLLLTGYADINAVIDAINRGKIYHYLTKPWNETELTRVIEESYQLYQKSLLEEEEKKKLFLSNQQMEFLLRQNLLS